MDRTGKPLSNLLAAPPRLLEQPLHALDGLFALARRVASSAEKPADLRVLAVQALTRARPRLAAEALPGLLRPQQPGPVQAAAARGLGDVGDPSLARQALEHWGTYTTGTRRELLTALLRSADLAAVLVEALEGDRLSSADLDPSVRDLLRRVPNPALQQRVRKLLPAGPSQDRQAVLRKYQPALEQAGDRRRGASVFAKNCLTCHQLQGQGHRVGPDLAGVAGRPRAALLEDILDPNKEVAPDYMSFVLVTTRGRVLTGLVAAETATTVKLRRADGVEDLVFRSEVQELRGSGKSLMPEGLEQSLGLQEMADLLEFLQQPGELSRPIKAGRE
jgi:putative heme-binding domain-containing protein